MNLQAKASSINKSSQSIDRQSDSDDSRKEGSIRSLNNSQSPPGRNGGKNTGNRLPQINKTAQGRYASNASHANQKQKMAKPKIDRETYQKLFDEQLNKLMEKQMMRS